MKIKWQSSSSEQLRLETDRYFDSLNLRSISTLVVEKPFKAKSPIEPTKLAPNISTPETGAQKDFEEARKEVKSLQTQLQCWNLIWKEDFDLSTQGVGIEAVYPGSTQSLKDSEQALEDFLAAGCAADLKSRAFGFKQSADGWSIQQPRWVVGISAVFISVALAGLVGSQSQWTCRLNSLCGAQLQWIQAMVKPALLEAMLTPPHAANNTNTNEFGQAVDVAMQTAEAAQTAQTQQEWQAIAQGWDQAIGWMKTVPASSPHYAIAQQRVFDYTRNLNYSRLQAQNFGNRLQFRAAVFAATQAAEATQTAQTKRAWQTIAHDWKKAIEAMKSVPAASPYYAIAQQRIDEYTKNLHYAKQKMAN